MLKRCVDATSLRHVMGHFATGVAVVTAVDDHGQPVGTTVNAVTSVSLEPPLVLVCLGLGSSTLRAVRERAAFSDASGEEDTWVFAGGRAAGSGRDAWGVMRKEGRALPEPAKGQRPL